MDIYINSFILQLSLLLFIFLFWYLCFRRRDFAGLILPVALPLYLVKLYIRPEVIVRLFSDPWTVLSSFFSPTYQSIPVLRPDFGAQGQIILPTNLLEVLIIGFLVINWRLAWNGFSKILESAPAQGHSEPCCLPRTGAERLVRGHPELSRCHPELACPAGARRRRGSGSSPRFQSKHKVALNKYLLLAILSLLLATVISTFYAINVRVALGAAKSWVFLPILLFFAFLSLLKNSQFRTKFLYSIAFSSFFITLTTLPFLLLNIFTYDGRLTGLFLSPNHLAMALVPGILALAHLLTAPKNLKSQAPISNKFPSPKPQYQMESQVPVSQTQLGSSHWNFIGEWNLGFGNLKNIINSGVFNILAFALLAGELVVLYLTYSYGTWLALLIPAFMLTVLNHIACPVPERSDWYRVILNLPARPGRQVQDDNHRDLYVKALMALLIIVVLAFSQLHNPKLAHILHSDYYSSLHSRLMIWQSALAISRDRWLTGIGLDNFQQAYLDYQSHFKEPYIEWSAPQPHNVFLAFLAELGVIGAIAFVAILFLSLIILINPKPQYPMSNQIQKNKSQLGFGNYKTDPLTLWGLAYIIYTIIHGLVDTPYFKNDLAILFWLALAAIWAAISTHTTGHGSRT